MGSKEKIIRIIGRTRVSTKEQSKTQHGSLEAQESTQLRWAEMWTEETGIKHEIIRFIREVKSGRKGKSHLRSADDEIIYAFQHDLCDGVSVESVARLGRYQKKNIELMEAAAKYGKHVFIDGKRYNHLNKGDRIKFGIENLMAEEESNDTSDRVTKKQREAMINFGKDTSTVPIKGLDAHPTKVGIYTPNWQELKEDTEIFNKFCELKSYKLLKDFCLSKGYRTKERWTKESTDKEGNRIPPKRVGGELYDEKRLRVLLTSPKLRGFNAFIDKMDQFPKLQDKDARVVWEYAHHREHGDLIDPTLIRKVDEVLASFDHHKPKTSKYGHVYLLTGVLRDHQGNPFYGSNGNGGRNTYYYNRTDEKSARKNIKKDEIESIVCNRVKQYLCESGTLERVMKAALKNRTVGLPLLDEEIPKVEKEIVKIEKVIQRFSETIRDAALHGNQDLASVLTEIVNEKNKAERDLDDLRENLRLLNEKKAQVETNLHHRTLKDYLQTALVKFEKKTDHQKKALIQAIVPEVVIHADNSVELKINPDPNGSVFGQKKSPFGGRHSTGHKIVLSGKWRGGRDSNPRPPA